jgi:xanthine dehydrogenase YagS FAD-binding subunit
MLRILYPQTASEATRAVTMDVTGQATAMGLHGFHREYKAGGTDVVDRLKHGVLAPDLIVDLKRLPKEDPIEIAAGQIRIHAFHTLAAIASNRLVQDRVSCLTDALDHTANPQIRGAATLAGSLCQRPRCEYLRHPDFICLKEGGEQCFAKEGLHSNSAIYDNAICAAVHPSTPGAALLALQASLSVIVPGEDIPKTISMDDFFSIDLTNPKAENSLQPGALIQYIDVPIPQGQTAQGYERASTRLRADWAQVEVASILTLRQDYIEDAQIVLGGVGRVPRHAVETEAHLRGQRLSGGLLKEAALKAATGAKPLSQNSYKVKMSQGAVLTALEKSLA